MSYQLPSKDVEFILSNLVEFQRLASLECYSDLGLNIETAMAITDEIGKVASEKLASCNREGDIVGATLVDGEVKLPSSFSDAFNAIASGGWVGLSLPQKYEGQGLPELFNTIAMENWVAGNMSLSLNPLLCIGAAMAINAHGSEEQKNIFLPKMASGQWSGAMDLTEPQSGSDLSTIKTMAYRDGECYRIKGQKIYISWGEHSLSENIVHLVLARTPDAPEGTRGISLFIVPKYKVDKEGNITERNDVECLSLEHKMGLHASPTCVMSFGAGDGAVGYLLGEENKGLACMFTMMNEARLKVGVQGLGIAERSYQQSLAFAMEREQPKPIISYPDVKRMLMTQRSLIEAMRSVAYVEAARLDIGHEEKDAANIQRSNLMIPIIKGWFSELGQEVSGISIQIHGGMGFVEETGVAQYARDIRVATIYEGTNGIQAEDLVIRKVVKDRGVAVALLIKEIEKDIAESKPDLQQLATRLSGSVQLLKGCVDAILKLNDQGDREEILANCHDFMMLSGYICGAWQLLRSLHFCSDDDFGLEKKKTAEFYINRILPRANAHAAVYDSMASNWL